MKIGEINEFDIEMITSVRFCLSYDLLNVILSPLKFVYFNENLHSCNGGRHDITCSRQKCYVMCGHNIKKVHLIQPLFRLKNTKSCSTLQA